MAAAVKAPFMVLSTNIVISPASFSFTGVLLPQPANRLSVKTRAKAMATILLMLIMNTVFLSVRFIVKQS